MSKKSQRRRPPSGWSGLQAVAQQAGLRGQRQWPLLLHLLTLGTKHRRGIFRGRRALARALGLATDAHELWQRVDGERVPIGEHRDQGGRNTRRRLDRFQQLGLVRLVAPAWDRADGLRVGGGRLRGSTAALYVGRAVRIYPGPALVPKWQVDLWIRADDLAEAGVQLAAVDALKAGRALTPGEVLQLDAAHRGLLRRASGADPP